VEALNEDLVKGKIKHRKNIMCFPILIKNIKGEEKSDIARPHNNNT